MSGRDPAPGDRPYLGQARAGRLAALRRWLAAAGCVARAPGAAAAVLHARITGRRLRARQRLAALVGVDHRLAVPRRVLRRFPPAGAAGDGRARDGGHDGGGGEGGAGLVVLGGDALVAGALARIHAAFAREPDLLALYGDALVETRAGGPVHPLLPPVFDPDLLRAVDYLGPVLAYRASALAPGVAPAGPADAASRIAERHGPRAIGHLPEILARAPARRLPARVEARADPRDAARGGPSRVADGRARTPLASLIVPTRDRLDLLRPCLESLRARTDWPALEILVCDNDSREPETLAYLRALEGEGRGLVVPCPGPFNFAAMNNAAAARARGDLLVFVNNDVEAFRPDWLALMAREALRPEVGAVGAKLLDGTGRVQHGGIVLGTGGLVTHAHRHFPGDAPGYLSALRATHRVSAVTAACLVVETEKFRAVGGFDDEAFAVDFNDVDLCLRLNAAGHRTLMVPGAVLHHREAASRRWTPEARARHEREIAALRARWGPLLAQDPHYHPGFDPDLSTHARLRAGFPDAGAAAVRRPPA